jgi:hypothetical protein
LEKSRNPKHSQPHPSDVSQSKATEKANSDITIPHIEPAVMAEPPKPPVKIIYVVKSGGSSSKNTLWRPEGGRFLDKELNQIVQELPTTRLAAEITRLNFSLCQGDDLDYNQPKWAVERNDEDGFIFLKKRFNRYIASCLGKTSARPLMFEMEIEPEYEAKDDTKTMEPPNELEGAVDW